MKKLLSMLMIMAMMFAVAGAAGVEPPEVVVDAFVEYLDQIVPLSTRAVDDPDILEYGMEINGEYCKLIFANERIRANGVTVAKDSAIFAFADSLDFHVGDSILYEMSPVTGEVVRQWPATRSEYDEERGKWSIVPLWREVAEEDVAYFAAYDLYTGAAMADASYVVMPDGTFRVIAVVDNSALCWWRESETENEKIGGKLPKGEAFLLDNQLFAPSRVGVTTIAWSKDSENQKKADPGEELGLSWIGRVDFMRSGVDQIRTYYVTDSDHPKVAEAIDALRIGGYEIVRNPDIVALENARRTAVKTALTEWAQEQVDAAVAPLNETITELQGQVSEWEANYGVLEGEHDALQAGYDQLEDQVNGLVEQGVLVENEGVYGAAPTPEPSPTTTPTPAPSQGPT